MTENKKYNTSIDIIRELEQIFLFHKWFLDSELEKEIFDRFCKMLEIFAIDQQECILELTKNFLRVDFQEYYNHIKICLSKIDQQILNPIRKIFIMPITSGKSNSSTFVAYIFNDQKIISHPILRDKQVIIADNYEELGENFNRRSNILLLVDDFIGSGQTVSNCLNKINNIIDSKKIIVLSLVIQIQGYELLKSRNIPIVYSVLRQRGISDVYQDPLRKKFIDLMRSIEEIIGVDKDLCFGYNQTEALVKMIRTPNNTFPVYWCKSKKNKKFIAPFKR